MTQNRVNASARPPVKQPAYANALLAPTPPPPHTTFNTKLQTPNKPTMAARKAFVDKVWQAFMSNKGHDANSFGHVSPPTFLLVHPGQKRSELSHGIIFARPMLDSDKAPC